MIAARRLSQTELSDVKLSRLIRPGAGIVEEQEQRVITPTLRRVALQRRRQRIHLRFFQICDGGFDSPLEWNCLNLPTPLDMFGTPFGNEVRQGMDCCQSLIARRNAAPANFFQVLQKLSDIFRRKMTYFELIHFFAYFAGDERNEQRQGITITTLRIPRQIAFANQMLQEKTAHPGSKSSLSHDTPPGEHTAQNAARLRGAV